jgi:hypothetical protein
MSIFQKLKAFLGLANVQLTDAQGAAITEERESELANSLEFHALLEGELKDVVASQAGLIATQAKAIADNEANYKAITNQVAELAAKIETTAANVDTLADIAQKQVENLQTKAEAKAVVQVDSKIGDIAKKLNAMLGKPLVESKEADAEAEFATGKISDAAKLSTIADVRSMLKR